MKKHRLAGSTRSATGLPLIHRLMNYLLEQNSTVDLRAGEAN
jgi:hypothetical protein